MWRTTIHSHGLEVGTSLRTFVEDRLRGALGGLERRVAHVHVRLYGDLDDNGLSTCYVRADVPPSGGVALGEAATDIHVAVQRALERVGRSVRCLMGQRKGANAPTADQRAGSDRTGASSMSAGTSPASPLAATPSISPL